MAESPELERSRDWCRATMRHHSKSFYFSTRVLPWAKRCAIEALYALFRYADDLADAGGLSDEQRRAAFARLYEDFDALEHAERAPWSLAVRDAFARFPIPRGDVRKLLRGCEGDLTPADVRTMTDLYRYSQAVAGTVGRCSLSVLGASDDDSLNRGERLGVAMQYTNVLRDVDEDRRMGRNYLPLQQYGSIDVREVMAEVGHAAREYFREAVVLAQRVPNDGSRMALLMTSTVYERILDGIERRGFDPCGERVYVSLAQKVEVAARSAVFSYAGFRTIR